MGEQRAKLRAKHPLLLYRRLASYWGFPSILLMLVSAGLLIWNQPALQGLRAILVLSFLLPFAILILTFAMGRSAHVQCREDGLLIQLPLYALRVPFESIVETRSAFMYELFPPSRQPISARGFLDPLWKMSAVVVRLSSLPQPRSRLRLWMDSRMIIPDGLVLLVQDYRGFRREIQDAMIHWRAGRKDA